MGLNTHKFKIVGGVAVVALLLAFLFWYGGNAPGSRGWSTADTSPIPATLPSEPEASEDVPSGAAYTCTLSVSCATILDNLALLDKEKHELVPADGWILSPRIVTFYEGESVFDLLRRTMTDLKCHLEFSFTPLYNSVYIEGINNLYEFDVGESSGWMYEVNDWFPNYGISRYQLRDGDVVQFHYTCDLGIDVGGGYAVGSP